jgi:hypothetical protein
LGPGLLVKDIGEEQWCFLEGTYIPSIQIEEGSKASNFCKSLEAWHRAHIFTLLSGHTYYPVQWQEEEKY